MATKNVTQNGSRLSAAMHAPAEIVQEYPLSTALLVFGVGLGVGVLLSTTVCDSMYNLMAPQPTMSQRLSRQFYDTLSHAVPESLRHFAA
jgi:hypothetical protein